MAFMDDNFMLYGKSAQEIYHAYAKEMPIVDFHNHLSPKMIAENHTARSITELWLGGDHYKWRLLRANGVNEKFITGDGDDFEKFRNWAETLPYAMRNPIYHWSHLELRRYFGEERILNRESAGAVYERCNTMIAEGGFGAMDLLRKMKVEMVCTTDDPIDSLEYHIAANRNQTTVRVLPTWRPDKVVAIESDGFNGYVDRLATVAGVSIGAFEDLLTALRRRQQHFLEAGCVASDHGLDTFYAENFTDQQVDYIFKRVRSGMAIDAKDAEIYKSGILYHLGVMNSEAGWVQQFHVGPLRNNSSHLFQRLGVDVGGDSINDKPIAESMGRFLDRLDRENALAKTILYNLNPKDTAVMASMCYNFNRGDQVGKMQYGAAWWFLDQMDGMTRQLEALSSLGLLSRFVGMLTDSRSFLSFVRHDYFRRLLCNVLGNDIDKGLLPASEMEFIGKMVSDISYRNAKQFFECK